MMFIGHVKNCFPKWHRNGNELVIADNATKFHTGRMKNDYPTERIIARFWKQLLQWQDRAQKLLSAKTTAGRKKLGIMVQWNN